ncbi:SHOCT domain-containing protein [Natrialba swarupiae]|uniref:SHOCT domain-containing protein n=2 Tax=Natrialba swarupiae TaxID=2448032 RepID=A0A5D5AF63_9EURY|nr:SHOCT domain-containing protein [Natrialba swarupiae]
MTFSTEQSMCLYMPQESSLSRLRGNATEILGLLFVSLMIIGLFTEFWLLIAGLIGLLFITPLIALLIGDQEAIEEWWGEEKAEQYGDNSEEDPLETLKRRYAEGELSEAEFEYKIQQLLEVDDIESVQRTADGPQTSDPPESVEMEREDR